MQYYNWVHVWWWGGAGHGPFGSDKYNYSARIPRIRIWIA